MALIFLRRLCNNKKEKERRGKAKKGVPLSGVLGVGTNNLLQSYKLLKEVCEERRSDYKVEIASEKEESKTYCAWSHFGASHKLQTP